MTGHSIKTGHNIVMAAPPTPNGDLHLGHLSGPYSGADIYTRAARLVGRSAQYVTGFDLHQSYVPAKAATLGVDAVELAEGYGDGIAAAFAAIGFQTDSCLRPQHSDLHRGLVEDFITTLYRNGKLVEASADCLYCPSCQSYLFEAYVSGGCPRCGARSDGNSCEVCAWPNRCTDLVDPRCNRCGSAAQLRQYQQLLFPLNQYAGRLREFCATTVMSPQLEALCAQLLATELPDIPISHPTGWGIPVPVPGFTDQRIYVWAEMVPGYFAGVANSLPDGADSWQQVWNSPDTELVQFFGFDNGYFHTLLHPALLMAYDDKLRLPDVQLTNEFYLLDDAKFSKSRGHYIRGADLLAGASASAVRFVLAHDRPETRRTNFSWQRFGQLCDDELAGRWQGWLAGLFADVQQYCDGRVPEAGELSASQRCFLDGLQRLAEETLRAYSGAAFSAQRAARCLIELVRQASEFAAGQARLRAGDVHSAAGRGSIAVELAAARSLALLAWPIMPDFGRQLWTALGCSGELRWDGVRLCEPGQQVATAPVFFKPYAAAISIEELADV